MKIKVQITIQLFEISASEDAITLSPKGNKKYNCKVNADTETRQIDIL